MITNFSKLQAAFAALALVAFVGRTSAATVKYAGTFAEYFGDAYQGGNDVLNDTERAWLSSGARFNGTWKAPKNTPYYIVEGYGDVDFGASNDTSSNTSLDKRYNPHSFRGYGNFDCAGANVLNVWNFGCGGGCIHFVNGLSSGSLSRVDKFPYPTAEMYTDPFCSDNRQHLGIAGDLQQACTNACCGWWESGYLYYDC
ncbi:hypothetical protein BJX63DRAFT_436582 [Aspergillus granulosus]|uniref:Uncharacterized protein n=1 Tax=Aspergillus granulosus TaxID=176169 RepID=A0ABR4GY01_9EURO